MEREFSGQQASPPGRQIRGLTDSANVDVETWPTPDEGAIVGDDLQKYLQRKQGVKMNFEGQSAKVIRATCGMGLSHVYRLITERCLEVHPDGLIYGFRGLVPNLRIKPYRRKNPVRVNVFGHGASGAMQTILDLHPDLRKAFEKRILESPKTDELGIAKRPRQSHWKWFLDWLREHQYEIHHEWPFNTKTNGYNTVCRYIDQVLAANPKKAARVIGGPDLEKKLLSGDGVDRPITEVFQRVEMDAHKLDGRFCVMLPQPSGGYTPKIVHRLWVLVILEIVSRAVLGYYLSMRREVSKEDVLRAIKNALSVWHPRKLSFSDVAYREGSGFPSSISPKFLRICWGETSIDGALAEKAKQVKDTLRDVVGSKLIEPSQGFSSRRSKDDRPFIEAFFRHLASGGFHKLTNTTGAKPSGKKGRDPAKVAINSQFQIEYAEELLDVLIANYNVTPHTALGNRSPLQYLEFVTSRGDIELRYADPNSVQSILSFRKQCRVRGGVTEGRRPYVNFEGARYSGGVLAQRHDLVGSYIWVVNHLEEDARVAQASTLDGRSLGILRAAPPWHKLPHSLRVRRAIKSCVQQRMFSVASGVDAIEVFLDYCEQQKDRKLPIHPAYLEARHILIHEAELKTGQSMLDVALERHESENKSLESKSSGGKDKDPKEHDQDQSPRPLPARRLAASS
ncbi:hypothetical protein GALL_390150 [mine drainage metagenome]|uniref:Integrase catalytic domain-containing protein n=1 Tax=mine drainage metagenome TaxID=410659 RepID=A0A1J5Q6F4_9ZZZZ